MAKKQILQEKAKKYNYRIFEYLDYFASIQIFVWILLLKT